MKFANFLRDHAAFPVTLTKTERNTSGLPLVITQYKSSRLVIFLMTSGQNCLHIGSNQIPEIMKRLTRFLILQLLLAFFTSWEFMAATVYSVQDGMWGDAESWGGTLPDLAVDSIVIAHILTIEENITLEASGRITILETGGLEEVHNKSLNLESGTVLYNAGTITISKMTNHGTIFNTGSIMLEGDLENHNGTIYNDEMIYAKNILTQSGMISGDGGEYMVENSLNTDPESIVTCTGDAINICNPDGVTDPCHGPGQFDAGCVSICGQLLDLNLMTFKAKSRQDMRSVEITWTTSHEVGISHFIVERCSSFSTTWIPVSPDIPAIGNIEDGIYQYSYVDMQPLVGVNIYRLVCYDLDDNFAYSFIVAVQIEAALVIGVTPNPFTSAIDIQGDLTGFDKLEIVGATGQVFWVFDTNSVRSLQLFFLENGWYMVRLTGASGKLIFPILKI